MNSSKINFKTMESRIKAFELSVNESLSKVLFGNRVMEFTDIPLPSEQKEKETEKEGSKKVKRRVWPKIKLGHQLKLFFKRGVKRVLYRLVTSAEAVITLFNTKQLAHSSQENHFRS